MTASPSVAHVIIRGRVQGVGYRAWMEDEASLRGLGGFVRNRRDGAVEALFAGPAETVEAMVAACWRGPPGARVDEVERLAADPDWPCEPRRRFMVLPTI